MKAPKKPTKIATLEMIPLATPRNLETKNLPKETTTRELKDAIISVYDKIPELFKPYLKLSAAKTMDVGKGYINAIGCRNMFPDGPNIDFVPQANDFSGKIEVWMLDVTKGESYSVSFRVICGYAGQWEIRSSETNVQYQNIGPVYQNIDFFIPSVKNDFGMALITLEPNFTAYGSWIFKDVTIRKVTFN